MLQYSRSTSGLSRGGYKAVQEVVSARWQGTSEGMAESGERAHGDRAGSNTRAPDASDRRHDVTGMNEGGVEALTSTVRGNGGRRRGGEGREGTS